ncbi:MAG: peptidoglycan-binding domain-containing protein, partial [Pseudomonadota bacterium]
PLTSPRFSKNAQLKDAFANSPWLKWGSQGVGVHLMQFALIDLGFPMPKSVGGKGLSPDGDFGNETYAVVKKFQESTLGGPAVDVDGVVGQNTLGKLDRAIGGFTHKISVHLRVVHAPDKDVSHYVSLAVDAYAQYGIKFEIASALPLMLSKDKKEWLEKQSTSGADVIKDPPRSVLAPFFPVKTSDILAYSLELFDPDTVYGLTTSNGSGAVVRLSKDQQDSTLAHEVGHALLTPLSGPDKEDHHPSINNLMGTGTRAAPYVLTIDQVKEMRTHLRCPKI